MLASFGGATFEPPAKAPPPRTGIDLFSPVTDAPRKGRRVFERQEAMKEHNYLAHVDGSNPADWGKPPAASSADGTHSSKFGIGFHRRQLGAMSEAIEVRRAHEEALEARRERTAVERRKLIEEQDKRNGFNVISGEFVADAAASRPARRVLSASGSGFLQREGAVSMRQSNNRFYRDVTEVAPVPREALVTEGLTQTVRKSAVLGHGGTSTMRSYGVADAFQYSVYDPAYRAPSPRDEPGPPIGGSRASASAGTPLSLSRGLGSSLSTPSLAPPRSRVSSASSALGASKPLRDVSTPGSLAGSSVERRMLESRSSRSERSHQVDVEAVRALKGL